MKVYVVMEEDRGMGASICGIYVSKAVAEAEWGDVLGSNYWLEEAEVNMMEN